MRAERSSLVRLTWHLVSIFAIFAVAAPARAIQLVWDNPAGGNAAVGNNWDPNQVPAPGDELAFNLDLSYQVTFDAALPTTFNHRHRNGNVTVVFSSPHTMTGPLEIAACCGDSARLTIPTGTLTCQSAVEIGDESTPNGRLVLNDGDVHLIKNGAGNFLVGGGSAAGGYGRLDVQAGAIIDIQSGDLILGHNGSIADGRVTVSGFQSGGNRSAINVTGGPGNDIIVGNANDATMIISTGGTVSCNSDILIAVGASSVATVEVVTATIPTSFLSTLDDLDIAGAGVGTLQVKNAGVVTIGDRTRLVGGTGTGTLQVLTGGKFVTQDLELSTGGTLDFRGGLIQVVGGVLDHDGQQVTISSTTGAPTLELRNGATATITSPGSPFDRLRIGADGQGQLNLLNGASCTVAAPCHMTVGNLAGGSGTVLMDSTSSLTSTVIFAGMNSDGQITVQGGSDLTTGDLRLGLFATGNGAIDVLGAGSTALVNDELQIGSASGGIGFVTISDGGSMEVHGLGEKTGGVNTFITANGVLNVFNGGVFTSTAEVEILGDLQLGDGTVVAQHVEVVGPISGTGTVNATVGSEDVSASITASGGPLTLGKASIFGFTHDGTLAVGAETVTLVDTDGPRTGSVTIAGGTLNFTGIANLAIGRSMTGNGLINGAVANSGTITAAGAGLRFDGVVTGIGQGISGTLINFLDDGGYTGAGTLNARVDGDAGSVITATGNLTLGNSASTTGTVLDGELHVGTQNVTLRDSDGIGLGSLTTLAGGQLAYVGNILSMSSTDELRGGGFIASTLRNGGLVTVGSPGALLLRITPEFANVSSGIVEVELGNHGTVENDVVQVTNEVNLAGTLHVKPLPTFNAQPGDQYTVMTWGTRNGTFTNVVFQGFQPGVSFGVTYNPNSLVLVLQTAAGIEEPAAIPEAAPAALTFTALTGSSAPPAFELGLPEAAEIEVVAYDVTGRQVADLFTGRAEAGWHRYSLGRDGRLARGVYFGHAVVRARGREESRVARLVLAR
jgi:hypothetical protein